MPERREVEIKSRADTLALTSPELANLLKQVGRILAGQIGHLRRLGQTGFAMAVGAEETRLASGVDR